MMIASASAGLLSDYLPYTGGRLRVTQTTWTMLQSMQVPSSKPSCGAADATTEHAGCCSNIGPSKAKQALTRAIVSRCLPLCAAPKPRVTWGLSHPEADSACLMLSGLW